MTCNRSDRAEISENTTIANHHAHPKAKNHMVVVVGLLTPFTLLLVHFLSWFAFIPYLQPVRLSTAMQTAIHNHTAAQEVHTAVHRIHAEMQSTHSHSHARPRDAHKTHNTQPRRAIQRITQLHTARQSTNRHPHPPTTTLSHTDPYQPPAMPSHTQGRTEPPRATHRHTWPHSPDCNPKECLNRWTT